jgi:hypothetical protein
MTKIPQMQEELSSRGGALSPVAEKEKPEKLKRKKGRSTRKQARLLERNASVGEMEASLPVRSEHSLQQQQQPSKQAIGTPPAKYRSSLSRSLPHGQRSMLSTSTMSSSLVASVESTDLNPPSLRPSIKPIRPELPPESPRRARLHSLFKWSHEAKLRTEPLNLADPPEGTDSLTKSVRGTGTPDSLLTRSKSTPNLQQYRLTPKWPTRRLAFTNFHAQFYEHNNTDPPVAAPYQQPHKNQSKEAPLLSPNNLLSIIEPCSMREVLTLQGFQEEFVPAEDHFMNYSDILDNQSLVSACTNQTYLVAAVNALNEP